MKIIMPINIALVVLIQCVTNLLTTEVVCPDQCVCSPIEMICSGANVSNVMSSIFSYKEYRDQVLHVDFSGMTVQYVSRIVSFMPNCKKLNLSSNHIYSIEGDFLEGLWGLEELILSSNSITDFASIHPSTLFYGNKNIKVLNLSNNPFTDLGKDINSILYSESLEVLDVSKCQITSLVGEMVLSELKNLTYLNLADNPLTRLDGLYSRTLNILNIRGCLLNYLSESALNGLKNLEILDSSQNDQLYLENTLTSPTLKTLDISLCSIRTPRLNGMTELRSVFLNGNRIKRLRNYQFVKNTKLVNLVISENNLNYVEPLTFSGLISLRYLDLSANSIAEISWALTMSSLPSLEIFNLSGNSISRVDVLKSKSLQRLDLGHCLIDSLPNQAFVHLDRLVELVLSNNPLQIILPGSLNTTHMSHLDLSYCRISHLISYEFVNSPNLTELKLTGNRLVAIKNGTFAKCPKLKYLYLDDNPWRCDCYSVDFAYMNLLANRTTNRFTSVDRLPLCLSPDNVTGVPWQSACANGPAAHVRDNRKNFSMAVGVILILCVSGLMAIFVAVHENMKTRRALRHHRHRRPSDDEYTIFDEYAAAAAESLRKMSQLPSYDEAIALPRPSAAAAAAALNAHRTKRHSCTQTDDEVDRDVAAVMAEEHSILQGGIYDDVMAAGSYRDCSYRTVQAIPETDDRFNNSLSSPSQLPPGLHVTRL